MAQTSRHYAMNGHHCSVQSPPVVMRLSRSYWTGDVFKLLLESGTDVDRVGRDGCSPLYRAVWHDNVELVDILLAHGANVNNEADGYWFPIKQAASNGNLAILEHLVQRGANTEADIVGQRSSLAMPASSSGKVDN